MSRVMPSVRREEWPVPFWVANRRLYESSLPVHKLVMVPASDFLGTTRPGRGSCRAHCAPPGGFLNSLTKRLWSKLDMEKVVRHGNRDRLAGLAACHPIWTQRFGDIATLSAVESELWYWRYAVETIHEAGVGNPTINSLSTRN